MDQVVNTKAIKFRTIAERRVSSALKTIRQIGNLSRRSSYDYKPVQVDKIFAVLRQEIDAAEMKFTPQDLLFKLD